MDQIPIYNPAEIEPKWQARWEADGLYHADIDSIKEKILCINHVALYLR